MTHKLIPSNYPRPDFARSEWQSLNGEWKFAYDDEETGEAQGWYKQKQNFNMHICVPFTYQTEASGINDSAKHDMVWYQRTFDTTENMKNKRVFLNFGSVDYETKVWLNGVCLGAHKGGYTPFSFDITAYIKQADNVLSVMVIDRNDTAQPRGKQFWKSVCDRCWYTPSTGIWQDVWLECTDGTLLKRVKLEPDIDSNTVSAQAIIDKFTCGDELLVTVSYKNNTVKNMRISLDGIRTKFVISLKEDDAIDEMHYWSPECPNLYDIEFELISQGKVTDKVQSYFGMRKVSIDNGRIMLNHRPYYLKMILDQGYWRKSGITPPTENSLKEDILMIKQMGFNGVRKHQKIEHPAFYYWADKLGLVVWGEVPSAYEFCDDEIENITRDFQEFVARDFNHPSIIAWVPLNESWGVRKMLTDSSQKDFGKALYHLAKALDKSRLVSTNDGWENVETDIISIHDYATTGKEFTEKYTKDALQSPEGIYPMHRRLYAYDETKSNNSVFMVTEYGGIALQNSIDTNNWGYGKAESDADMLISRYAEVTNAIKSIPQIIGYCYTQLTDVYQEVNGLLDFNHKPKFDLSEIKKINDGNNF